MNVPNEVMLVKVLDNASCVFQMSEMLVRQG